MQEFVIGQLSPTQQEEFTIVGSDEPMLAIYTDSQCTNRVSQGSNLSAVEIVVGEVTHFYARNETSRPITAVRVAPVGGLADRIAIAVDCSGQPTRFADAGEPAVWRGVLMPNEVIKFLVKAVPRKSDEAGIYDCVLSIDAEIAVDSV